jgi:hypothetical protein
MKSTRFERDSAVYGKSIMITNRFSVARGPYFTAGGDDRTDHAQPVSREHLMDALRARSGWTSNATWESS